MTNLDKIEKFLQNMVVEAAEKDATIPIDKVSLKLSNLVAVIRDMDKQIGDDKIVLFFKNILSSLVLETKDSPLRDLYMKTLTNFNSEFSERNNLN